MWGPGTTGPPAGDGPDGESGKRLFSTISEQDFNQNVREVAYSIYLAVYWPIAQNVGTSLGNKDQIYIYPSFL